MLTEAESTKTAVPLERVLIVDDEAAQAGELKRQLTELGFKVSVAREGGQAHASIRMNAPDIVMMEALLPGESGFEITEKIKQHHPRIPIMIYTTITLDSARNLAHRVGADGFLSRPASSGTLKEMMHEVAEAVWERIQENKVEVGLIRFQCRCGQRMREKFENRGRYTTCTNCQDKMQIPTQSDHAFITRDPNSDDSEGQALEPLKFVTIKCPDCATFYRLSSAGANWKTCPHCGHVTSGSLSIVGAPMSRAALESSLRVLRILNGKSKGKKMMLPERKIVFGRAEGSDIRHGSSTVSDRHCSLEPVTGGVLIEDLGSETGTYIDCVQVTSATLLRPSSVLRIGALQFRLIGEDLEVEDELKRVQQWSEKEKEYRERGIRLIEAGKETAAEAAQVIQQHWNIMRKKASGRLGTDDSADVAAVAASAR